MKFKNVYIPTVSLNKTQIRNHTYMNKVKGLVGQRSTHRKMPLAITYHIFGNILFSNEEISYISRYSTGF